MKRETIHAGFAIAVICVSVVALVQWRELRISNSIKQALGRIPATLSSVEEIAGFAEQVKHPAVILSTASALAAGSGFAESETMFNELIRKHQTEQVGQSAQFNLANAYLRQGMREDVNPSQTEPMLELAKQRYRDLLRVTPNDWDARYNLERALRLAPENAGRSLDKGDPIKSVRVIVPDFNAIDLP